MRSRVISSADVARCPTHRLDAAHYLDAPAGSCMCYREEHILRRWRQILNEEISDPVPEVDETREKP